MKLHQVRAARARLFANVADSMAAFVCRRYGLTRDELYGDKRGTAGLNHARFEFWLSLNAAGMDYSSIGRLVGRKHSTVLRGCRALRNMGWQPIPIATDTGLRVESLTAKKVGKVEPVKPAPKGDPAAILHGVWLQNPTADNDDQRARFERITEIICGFDLVNATALWMEFCRSEWPHSWQRQAAQMPRAFEMRMQEAA